MVAQAFTRFRDRRNAGERLARRLAHLKGNSDVRILALPRGGVGAHVCEGGRLIRLRDASKKCFIPSCPPCPPW
jgi:hypothetical protein